MMATLDAVHSLTLDLPPSCIVFCPTQPRLFVVGTYYLHGKEQEGDLRGTTTEEEAENSATRPASEDPESVSPSPDGEEDEEIASQPQEHVHQKRTGSLILFQLDPDDNITLVSTITTDFAVLDIQWTPHPGKLGGEVLAVATSTGLLAFYRLHASSTHGQQQQLILSCVKRICEPTILVLSLTWHPFRAHALGLTLSDGRVLLCESTCNTAAAAASEGSSSSSSNAIASDLWSQDAVITTHEIQQHELEAWTLAFMPPTRHEKESVKVLSGGDDIVLQCSSDDPPAAPQIPLWKDRKLHSAGITAILPLSNTLVVTGSYDDHIRLLHLPAVGRKQTLASLCLGGGVWRLKLLSSTIARGSSGGEPTAGIGIFGVPNDHVQQHNPTNKNKHDCHMGLQADEDADAKQEEEVSALRQSRTTTTTSLVIVILASCMHAGARIVKLVRRAQKAEAEGEYEWEWEFQVLAKFEKHKSMNYGSDVQPQQQEQVKEGESERRIVSTSFYDRLLCLWKFDL